MPCSAYSCTQGLDIFTRISLPFSANTPESLGAGGRDAMHGQQCEALRKHGYGGNGAVESVDVGMCHCGVPVALIFSGQGHDVGKICRDASCLTPDRFHLPVNHMTQNTFREGLAEF
jgi:hypothetical protein